MESQRTQEKEVTEILQLLVKTFGQMKIFSFEHENVRRFSHQLFDKLKTYLDKHWKLEIGIEEFSFTWEGKSVYTDEQISHSLPFFFYKDGMISLFLYKDLQHEEFFDFLEIIKKESSLPAEEGDIVSAFWERDFPNIRYYAPDEYLESLIGRDVDMLDYSIDKADLFSGKIELAPEDRIALEYGNGLAQSVISESIETPKTDVSEEVDVLATDSFLDQEEVEALESMLRENRHVSPDKEIISLLLEILFLEKGQRKFKQTLKVLEECHTQYIAKGDFANALSILSSLRELEDKFSTSSSPLQEPLESFLQIFRIEAALFDIKQSLQSGKVKDWRNCLEYLHQLGPETLPLVAFIYESPPTSHCRQMAGELLLEQGKQSPSQLLYLAQKDKPELTKEVIRIAGLSCEPACIPDLAHFLNYPDFDIRLAVIQALGRLQDAKANKLLAACFTDPEEKIRIAAAHNLRYLQDRSVSDRVLQIIHHKDFYRKNRAEKKAFLNYLSTMPSSEASQNLQQVLKRSGRLARANVLKTSLIAAVTLEKMATPEARDVLKTGSRSSNKRLRERCLSSLKKIAPEEG